MYVLGRDKEYKKCPSFFWTICKITQKPDFKQWLSSIKTWILEGTLPLALLFYPATKMQYTVHKKIRKTAVNGEQILCCPYSRQCEKRKITKHPLKSLLHIDFYRRRMGKLHVKGFVKIGYTKKFVDSKIEE